MGKDGWYFQDWLEGDQRWERGQEQDTGQALTWPLRGWLGASVWEREGGHFLVPKGSSGLEGLKKTSATSELLASPRVESTTLQEEGHCRP